jgi:hypothetical protein
MVEVVWRREQPQLLRVEEGGGGEREQQAAAAAMAIYLSLLKYHYPLRFSLPAVTSTIPERGGWTSRNPFWSSRCMNSYGSIILFANLDISRHILVVDTFVLAKSNMVRRK